MGWTGNSTANWEMGWEMGRVKMGEHCRTVLVIGESHETL